MAAACTLDGVQRQTGQTEVSPSPPPSPRLAEAERAFEVGDWHRARSLAREELAASGGDDSGEAAHRRHAARALLDRFRPDPQLVALYLAAAALFVAVCFVYLRR